MAYTTVSLGYSTTSTDTTPATTPAGLQSLICSHVPLAAHQTVEPYEYVDKSSRGFASNLVYETEIDLFPGQGAFDFTAAGIANSRNLDLWAMNEPKFCKSTDATWTDRLGTGWIRVTLTGKYDLEKANSMNHYVLHVRCAATVALT